jgi:hypothetical protein
MNDPPTDPIAAARRSYAEELRLTAHVRSPAVIAAFATVLRERFVGPGPWRVLSPMGPAEHWTDSRDFPVVRPAQGKQRGAPLANHARVLLGLCQPQSVSLKPGIAADAEKQAEVAVR